MASVVLVLEVANGPANVLHRFDLYRALTRCQGNGLSIIWQYPAAPDVERDRSDGLLARRTSRGWPSAGRGSHWPLPDSGVVVRVPLSDSHACSPCSGSSRPWYSSVCRGGESSCLV